MISKHTSMRKLLTIAAIMFFFPWMAYTQLDVRKVGKDFIEPEIEGFFYSLPRTGIRVDIQVKKTQRIKGPFSEFTDKYLGISQVINLNSTEYELEKIQMSTLSQPDPGQYYFVGHTGSRKDQQPVELFLSSQGALVGVEGSPLEFRSEKKSKEEGTMQSGLPEIPNPSLFERVDTVIRRISVDTTTIEQKVFKKISSAKTTEQKAKEAADFILKLDESMFNLINGYQEVSYEKGTMEYMYSQMEKLRNDYLQLFKGVTVSSSETYSYTYFPESGENGTPFTLCKFSLSKGILDKSNPSGDIIQLEVKSLDVLSGIRPVVEQRNKVSKGNKGIYYCIPEEAYVTLKLGGQVQLESRFLINQLGVVTYLPPSAVNNLELYNNTGGIKHVKIW